MKTFNQLLLIRAAITANKISNSCWNKTWSRLICSLIILWKHHCISFHRKCCSLSLLWCYVVTPQVHGQKAVWEDPVEWVRGTLPWPSAQQDQAKLFHLPPPSIGSSSPCQPSEERPHKETPPSSMENDPLVIETVSQYFLLFLKLICKPEKF